MQEQPIKIDFSEKREDNGGEHILISKKEVIEALKMLDRMKKAFQELVK